MKSKILIALKTKYKNLGFGEKAFEGVAEYLATTVTDEANIETAIGGVETMLKAFQSEADKLRGENATLKTQLEAAKKTETKTDETANKDGSDKSGDGDGTPAWAKKMFEGFEGIQKKLEALEADKVTGSRKSRLDDKLKSAPESLKNMVAKNFGKMRFDSDTDFDEYLTEVSTQVEDFAKEMKIDGVAGNGKSQKGTSSDGNNKEATKEELDAVNEKLII